MPLQLFIRAPSGALRAVAAAPEDAVSSACGLEPYDAAGRGLVRFWQRAHERRRRSPFGTCSSLAATPCSPAPSLLSSVQRIVHEGRTLDPRASLAAARVRPYGTLELLPRLRGGGGDGGSTGAESRSCYLEMYAGKKRDKVRDFCGWGRGARAAARLAPRQHYRTGAACCSSEGLSGWL